MFFRVCSPRSMNSTGTFRKPVHRRMTRDRSHPAQRCPQACGDVDTIPEDVIALDQDVAEVDPDPEQHPAINGHPFVPLGHHRLHDLHTRPYRPPRGTQATRRPQWSSRGAPCVLPQGHHKASAAILRDVTELCKAPIGQLGALAGIQMGQIHVPKSQLRQLFNTQPRFCFQRLPIG